MKDYLVIIPAYNEEENIENVVKDIKENAAFCDLIVINDGSTDNTGEIVRKHGLDVVTHPFNLGYGVAIYTGFLYANSKKYDAVILMDADGQHSAKDIVKFIRKMKDKKSDLIIGSRYLGKYDYKTSIPRLVGHKFFSFITSLILKKKITDPVSGFKLLNRKAYSYFIESGFSPSEYFDSDILILLGLNNFNIEEIPIRFASRNYGESMHVGLKPISYIYKMLLSIIIIFLSHKFKREY
jgi:hypothetical protein